MIPTLLSNLAQPLFLIALIIHDILWLRIVLILAEVCLLTLGIVVSDVPLICWNVLFIGINWTQVVRLIRERQPAPIAPELEDLYTGLFPVMTTREFVTFWSMGRLLKAAVGPLIREGETPGDLSLLLSGEVAVEKGGQRLDRMGRGSFFGEMEFLTGQSAMATVVCTEQGEYIAWSKGALKELERTNPQTYIKLQGILGKDLIEKIKHHHDRRP